MFKIMKKGEEEWEKGEEKKKNLRCKAGVTRFAFLISKNKVNIK